MSMPYEFKINFMTVFAATWCATNHTEYCMQGKHAELANPPMEDAEHLAQEVWDKLRREELL